MQPHPLRGRGVYDAAIRRNIVLILGAGATLITVDQIIANSAAAKFVLHSDHHAQASQKIASESTTAFVYPPAARTVVALVPRPSEVAAARAPKPKAHP
jgi:hypothetical protein